MDRHTPQNNSATDPVMNVKPESEEGETIKKPRFIQKDGVWYFDNGEDGLLGPFDKIHDTVMCEWRNTERTLIGDKMSDALAPYAVAA